MSLLNARYYARGHFSGTNERQTLEEQVLQPIQNDVEMGLTLDEAAGKNCCHRILSAIICECFW